MSEEAEAVVDSYRSDRFEFQFFRIPFEGTIGWQVRDTRDGSVGVLMQDTDGWKEYMERIEKRGMYVDFSDIQVEVVFLTSQGLWSHEHINPIYLELDRYFSEEDSEEARAKGKAMEYYSLACFHPYSFSPKITHLSPSVSSNSSVVTFCSK